MAKYCKAYSLKDLKEFRDWAKFSKKLKKEKKIQDGKEIWIERELKDDDYLYLHDNYLVTDGIFFDQDVIFDKITADWKEFCIQTLKFQIPSHDIAKIDH